MANNDFAEKVNVFLSKIVPEKVDAKIRRIAMACYSQVITASPVDEGTFRANWKIAFGKINREFDDSLDDHNTSFAQQTSQALAMIGSQQNVIGTSIFICNSAPYAVRLEHGYSRQAPAGIIGPAVRNIKAAIEAGAL